MIRIGIIGMGGYAAEHWQCLEELQRDGLCRIVATAVIDPEHHVARLEQARSAGVEVFGTAMEMFDAMRGRMEAVTIPTSIQSHAELMISAVNHGYHVYLEKPPAATIQEVDEMLAAARRTGRLCAVGFQALWSPSMAYLKRRLSEGAVGRVERIACSAGWIRRQDYYARNAWAGRLRIGGAWVLDGTCNNPLAHQVANVLYLASPQPQRLASPLAVRAELYAGHAIESEDTAAIEIFTAEGPRCYFLATLCADENFHPEITVVGTEGTAYRHFHGQTWIRRNDGHVEQPVLDDSRQVLVRFENFLSAVAAEDARLLSCHLEMVRPFTLAVNGAFESSRRVQPIPPQCLRLSGEGLAVKTVIEGIDAAIPQAASRGRLFSDLQLPWARRTAAFDLAGYERFPQQFELPPAAGRPAAGGAPFGA